MQVLNLANLKKGEHKSQELQVNDGSPRHITEACHCPDRSIDRVGPIAVEFRLTPRKFSTRARNRKKGVNMRCMQSLYRAKGHRMKSNWQRNASSSWLSRDYGPQRICHDT